MYFFMILFGSNVIAQEGQSQCSQDEQVLFSCTLKKTQKVISLCASKDLSANSGYLQYRFGPLKKIELAIPQDKKGMPKFTLTASKDDSAEYNEFSVDKTPFTYLITSFLQIKKINKEGYPTPKTEDSLGVQDSRKSMKGGNWLFNDVCQSTEVPLDAHKISGLTGVAVERGGF